MKTQQRLSLMARALGALLLLACSGCLQIETRVKVHEDGSATITERVRFTRQLLDLAGERKPELLKMLGREAVLERMKKMGQSLALVKHELRDAEGASKECFSEFTVDDVSKFQYVSPWLAYADYPENHALKFELVPLYNGPAGNMAVNLRYVKNPRGQPPPPKDGPVPGARTPRDLQVYRDMGPIARDLLNGFRLRFSIESYAPVHSGLGVRGESGGATSMDLLDVSDANLDKWGGPFFENEEVMLELTQLQFGGRNQVDNVREYGGNETVPVFFPAGSPHMWFFAGGSTERVYFAPSRQLFDKHFAGKKLDYPHGPTQVPAEFEKIGWKPREKTAPEPAPKP